MKRAIIIIIIQNRQCFISTPPFFLVMIYFDDCLTDPQFIIRLKKIPITNFRRKKAATSTELYLWHSHIISKAPKRTTRSLRKRKQQNLSISFIKSPHIITFQRLIHKQHCLNLKLKPERVVDEVKQKRSGVFPVSKVG